MRRWAWLALTVSAGGCAPGDAGVVEVRVPRGANAVEIARELQQAGLIDHPRLFALFARARGTAATLKSGRYRFPERAGWIELLTRLERGEVVTEPLTVPEGFELRQIATRLSGLSGIPAEEIQRIGSEAEVVRRLGVPGPTLEGYLFPDTYRFAEGVTAEEAFRAMVRRYQAFWTEERRARAASLGLDEREIVTLASIVEKEARVPDERPVIAAVYHNRLQRGMRLQADPTVQYALGEPKERLLYRDIDSVADDPFNTYTHDGLPPGPIGSPGEAALLATLHPADVPWLFFVARPDGTHVFTRTERDHINAKNRIRREAATARP